jgi:hypothetical protein
MHLRGAVSMAVALTLTAMAVACARSPQAPSSVAPRTMGAGISDLGDGRVEAAGYVIREGIEGGFWTLSDRPMSTSSVVQPKIIAVLLPGSVSEAGIAARENSFVVVSGQLQTGPSIRMAGPEVIVDTIAPARPEPPR